MKELASQAYALVEKLAGAIEKAVNYDIGGMRPRCEYPQHQQPTTRRMGTTVIYAEVDGMEASRAVEVYYPWWQWLIVIFLFGWIWY